MVKRNFTFFLLIIAIFIFSTTLFSEEKKSYQWARDGVGYQIFLRSFYDSDGNGIGDINGLIEKLDYLNDGKPGGNDLGIDYIWLNPIFYSKSFHGYDVIDYYKINPKYGTLDDFKRLIKEADKRGIKILLDLTLNHCATQHPYFLEARADKNSDKRDWFIFADKDLGWQTWTGGSGFHKCKTGYYYAGFGLPDWNLKNPKVTKYLIDIAKYWLSLGIGGYRLDAVIHLMEDEVNGKVLTKNSPSTFTWLHKFVEEIHKDYPDAFMIGEAWELEKIVADYTNPNKGGLPAAFNFELRKSFLLMSQNNASYYGKTIARLKKDLSPEAVDVPFTGNHDMGRLASRVKDFDSLKNVAKLILLIPGSPMIYYGDEYGMLTADKFTGDIRYRTIMCWNDKANAGYTTNDKAGSLVSPDWKKRNVAKQLKDKKSLLNTYRTYIGVRKMLPGLPEGQFVEAPSTKQLLNYFVVGKDHTYFIENNFSKSTQTGFIKADSWTEKLGLKAGDKIKLKVIYGDKKDKIYTVDIGEENIFTKLKGFAVKIFEVIK